MPRALTNKQIVVLQALRANGPMTVQQIADHVHNSTPCPTCGGSGAGADARYGCRPCHGRGKAWFGYSDAYQALQRLPKDALVSRECRIDQFGDEIRMHVYSAAAEPDPDDPLEKLWALPEANHG